jgi:hypothetical protein
VKNFPEKVWVISNMNQISFVPRILELEAMKGKVTWKRKGLQGANITVHLSMSLGK